MSATSEVPILENGHQFVTGASLGFAARSILHDKHVCLECGIVRRSDGKNGKCKGKVRVTVRGVATPIIDVCIPEVSS